MHSPESNKTQPLFEDSDPLHGLRTTNTQVRASKFSGSEANEGGKNVKNQTSSDFPCAYGACIRLKRGTGNTAFVSLRKLI
jgi:hypothetical protein